MLSLKAWKEIEEPTFNPRKRLAGYWDGRLEQLHIASPYWPSLVRCLSSPVGAWNRTEKVWTIAKPNIMLALTRILGAGLNVCLPYRACLEEGPIEASLDGIDLIGAYHLPKFYFTRISQTLFGFPSDVRRGQRFELQLAPNAGAIDNSDAYRFLNLTQNPDQDTRASEILIHSDQSGTPIEPLLDLAMFRSVRVVQTEGVGEQLPRAVTYTPPVPNQPKVSVPDEPLEDSRQRGLHRRLR